MSVEQAGIVVIRWAGLTPTGIGAAGQPVRLRDAAAGGGMAARVG